MIIAPPAIIVVDNNNIDDNNNIEDNIVIIIGPVTTGAAGSALPSPQTGCRGKRKTRGVRSGALRLGCCREDSAIVALQDLKPACDVGRVVLARLERQIEIGAQERGSELRDEFCIAQPCEPDSL